MGDSRTTRDRVAPGGGPRHIKVALRLSSESGRNVPLSAFSSRTLGRIWLQDHGESSPGYLSSKMRRRSMSESLTAVHLATDPNKVMLLMQSP